jgi:uncharacterized membrane protein YphA (DoxX/SURF4 family)
MKFLGQISRFLVGGLFIFSGLIKLNDPMGTAIKLEEYFEVFSQDLSPVFHSLIPAALFLSIFLSVLEVVLGIALLLVYRLEVAMIMLIFLLIFFTGLTFYSAYYNKVTDCGCFGDAIKLTPWQSFYKDIVLLVLSFIAFFTFDKFNPVLKGKPAHVVMGLVTLISTFIALWALWHLPFIDFRSYAVGNDLKKMMRAEEQGRYEYVMEKDGKEYRFSEYPSDTTYTYKDAILLNPDKAHPKITDLHVWDDEGDYTDEMLTGIKMIYIFHHVKNVHEGHLEEMRNLYKQSEIETWILTSAPYAEIEPFRHKYQLPFPFYFADATVLKTIMRSNPGIWLLKDGVVVGKWHHNDVPGAEKVKALVR